MRETRVWSLGREDPLQYSCLENSMDGGAWWATVHEVAKSQTWLSDFTHGEVKRIEKRDSVLMSKNQIERLTRPGSSYFNLNPFEVLQIDPEVTDEEIKKRFQQLSILVHPDKNQDDADRAQKAFEGICKFTCLWVTLCQCWGLIVPSPGSWKECCSFVFWSGRSCGFQNSCHSKQNVTV